MAATRPFRCLEQSFDDRHPAHARPHRHRRVRRAGRLGGVVPALPAPAAEDRGPPDAAGSGRAPGDPARPVRRPPRLRPHPARPLLCAGVLPRAGPALAARVLPPGDCRAPRGVRRARRPPRRPPDAHARHAPRGRARGPRDRRRRGPARERLRRRHQCRDRRGGRAPDRVPAHAARSRAVDRRGPAVLGKADGLRPVHQLGDGVAARRPRARGRPGASRAAGAAIPARESGDHLSRRRVRRRGSRHRGADRRREGVARAGDARDRLQQLGGLGRTLRDGPPAARVRPAPDSHDSRPLVRGRPRLRRLPRARRDVADQPVPGVRRRHALRPGASPT